MKWEKSAFKSLCVECQKFKESMTSPSSMRTKTTQFNFTFTNIQAYGQISAQAKLKTWTKIDAELFWWLPKATHTNFNPNMAKNNSLGFSKSSQYNQIKALKLHLNPLQLTDGGTSLKMRTLSVNFEKETELISALSGAYIQPHDQMQTKNVVWILFQFEYNSK